MMLQRRFVAVKPVIALLCMLVIGWSVVSLCKEFWPAPRPKPMAPPPPDSAVEFCRDLVYGVADGRALLINVGIPRGGEGPFPAVVLIHGGWMSDGDHPEEEWLVRMVRAGYVAAAIRYRYIPEYHFPAQVEDVKCAVRYLRSAARELKIDPEHIGAMGTSGGGYLALMLAVLGGDERFEGNGGHAEFSSRVQAVVNFCGPADMSLVGDDKRFMIYHEFLGRPKSRDDEVYRVASPVTYVHADQPPILTFHGTEDLPVNYEHARRLEMACRRVGARHELITMYGRDHERPPWTVDPVIEFFDFYLNARSTRVISHASGAGGVPQSTPSK